MSICAVLCVLDWRDMSAQYWMAISPISFPNTSVPLWIPQSCNIGNCFGLLNIAVKCLLGCSLFAACFSRWFWASWRTAFCNTCLDCLVLFSKACNCELSPFSMDVIAWLSCAPACWRSADWLLLSWRWHQLAACLTFFFESWLIVEKAWVVWGEVLDETSAPVFNQLSEGIT